MYSSHVIVDPLGVYMENLLNVVVETLPSLEIFMPTVGSIKKQVMHRWAGQPQRDGNALKLQLHAEVSVHVAQSMHWLILQEISKICQILKMI